MRMGGWRSAGGSPRWGPTCSACSRWTAPPTAWCNVTCLVCEDSSGPWSPSPSSGRSGNCPVACGGSPAGGSTWSTSRAPTVMVMVTETVPARSHFSSGARTHGPLGSTSGPPCGSPAPFATTWRSARSRSEAFREAYRGLVQEYRLNPDHPGFDILSLRRSGGIERCIELKSSGVAARIQEMTWNEWKVSNTGLAELYFLYLVGNLRADLPDALPFVRTIHNPVQQLLGFPMEERSTRRKVQLHVASFRQAEELVLQVADSQRKQNSGY
ncbi:MAG: DUF3883 domain-containing protein [Thermoleophilia bacterium]|nr:DUF3883 domain-containing protein [Thermoleophilia bacterium]